MYLFGVVVLVLVPVVLVVVGVGIYPRDIPLKSGRNRVSDR